MSYDPSEVQAAVDTYVATRKAIDDGKGTWADLAPLFTDDVVYIDPAWGRIEGIDAVKAELLGEAMDGLEDWTFPIDAVMIDGDRVMTKWRQEFPGADGVMRSQSGYSTLLYGGGGKFRYNEDLLNMAHVIEDIISSGWRPPEGGSIPTSPEHPNRDFSIPG